MFRFTIRDVLLFTTIVALGMGWGLERRQSIRLRHDTAVIENEVQQSRVVIKNLYEDLDKINQELSQHGLTLSWSSKLRTYIQTLDRSNQ